MRPLSLALPAFLGPASISGAQSASAREARSAALTARQVRAASDSAAHARVLEHVWVLLAPQLLAASLDTTSQAWTIAFPADAFPWARATAHLRVALRARTPLPDDTTVQHLTISTVRVAGDTAWATVTTDYEQRCGGGARPAGWGNRHEVFAPRVAPGSAWGPARTRRVVHGDRVPCLALSR